jgi:catechol 2,3-dioxygenase-like lactoylglutathione lyase family enzyme
MKLRQLDHVVLTVADMSRTITFYRDLLGMRHKVFEGKYHALHFGASQKINLHPYRAEYQPHALMPRPGTADLCFVCEEPIEIVAAELSAAGVLIEVGPVDQTGAAGSMRSVYIRDPDQNLIELASYARIVTPRVPGATSPSPW